MTVPEDKSSPAKQGDAGTNPPARPNAPPTLSGRMTVPGDKAAPAKQGGAGTNPSAKPKEPPTLSGRPRDVDTFTQRVEGSQALYLRAMTEQLTGWDDPRSMLERALKENLFLLFTQKILPLKSGISDPLCYEVLLRLKQEEDNLLPPGGFFDVAESLGMMASIDRWVVRAVLSWCAARQKQTPEKPLPMMCVNISAPALKNTSFLGEVQTELKNAGVPPRVLCFELCERDVLDYPAAAKGLVAALKPLGCRFTLDAFGSVKVSFTYLSGLPVDFVKIDGVIIDSMAQGPFGAATVKAINVVCKEVGIRTIAEFVETRHTLDKLREIGVDYVQGFGIARPEPIGNISG